MLNYYEILKGAYENEIDREELSEATQDELAMFESIFWSVEEDEFDAIYQILQKREDGARVVKFVGLENEDTTKITDEYPTLKGYNRYSVEKIIEAREKLRNEANQGS